MPGDVLQGTVSQSSADNLVFEIVSINVRTGANTSLAADMRGVSGWKPNWAEAMTETYSVTDCEQLPCSAPMAAFSNVTLVTTANGTIASVPWTSFYEEESVSHPGKPICGGVVDPTGVSNGVNITFLCG